jgi:NAD(P)H-dependent FMN reductase
MITIIVGTNRPGSNTERIAKYYKSLLEQRQIDHAFLHLDELPVDFIFNDMWGNRSAAMEAIISRAILPADKYVFVMPEYNGGFPGILKAFIDCVPPKVWQGKKAGLVGVATGKAGALRPMDQFTNILNYLKVSVLYAKPKLSEVQFALNESGEVTDARVMALLEEHAALMVAF